MPRTISAASRHSRSRCGRVMRRCCLKRTSLRLSIDGRSAIKYRELFVTRRDMLSRMGMGMGAVALTSLLGDAGHLQAASTGQAINPLAPRKPPLPAKAKRVLHLFMNGGCSHVDTFDT